MLLDRVHQLRAVGGASAIAPGLAQAGAHIGAAFDNELAQQLTEPAVPLAGNRNCLVVAHNCRGGHRCVSFWLADARALTRSAAPTMGRRPHLPRSRTPTVPAQMGSSPVSDGGPSRWERPCFSVSLGRS